MREIKAHALEETEYLDQQPPQTVRLAELVVRFTKENPSVIELVKNRYGHTGLYFLAVSEVEKEQEISDRIDLLENEIERLYSLRKGKMVDNDWGWCIGCGKVKVCASDGNDTCGDCLERS